MGMIFLNGKEYTSSPKDGFPPIIYSDEEREIGVWRDGKPLYQKSFYMAISAGTSRINHNIANLGQIANAYGMTIPSTSVSDKESRPIPFVYSTDSSSSAWYSGFTFNNTEILLQSGASFASRHSNAYITVQYTKTTDVAGSGKYTTYGGIAHHYSTSEQVIGTWIDGKPLYERVFNIQIVPSDLPSNYLSQYNVKSVKWGYIHTWAGNQEILSEKFVYNTNTKEFTSTEYTWSDFMYLQYTKTTDV